MGPFLDGVCRRGILGGLSGTVLFSGGCEGDIVADVALVVPRDEVALVAAFVPVDILSKAGTRGVFFAGRLLTVDGGDTEYLAGGGPGAGGGAVTDDRAYTDEGGGTVNGGTICFAGSGAFTVDGGGNE